MNLQRDFRLVEVFLNGEYYGLYCMAPKTNETYLNLAEGDYLYRIEDVENTDNVEDFVNSIFLDSENRHSNICDYNFFLQATGSMKNAEEDFSLCMMNQRILLQNTCKIYVLLWRISGGARISEHGS